MRAMAGVAYLALTFLLLVLGVRSGDLEMACLRREEDLALILRTASTYGPKAFRSLSLFLALRSSS